MRHWYTSVVKWRKNNVLCSLKRAITIATPVNERIIDQALVSDFDDLEDAMQYFSAVGAKVDVVLTRNKKDFIEISVPVMTPDEFFID